MIDKNFDHSAEEPRIYAAWERDGCFAPVDRTDADNYCIVIPPPNVTGSLHMGHALNNTLQDILVRFERMRGKNVLWQVGTDHAGIATQMVVERQMAERKEPPRRDIGRDAFIDKVWAWKAQSGGMITEQLRRLGASVDWSRERFTMDEGLSKAVRKVFIQLYKEGLIYRDKRLVNWDPHFRTAISNLEVENREVDGEMWHFKYPLAGGETYRYIEHDATGNIVLEEERDYISIATTRPETMLGDGAIAVHPDDTRYTPIIGKLCEIPVGPKGLRRLIPILTDEYPDPDFGSGAVKITGAHDFNDYAVAKRANIPLYTLMDDQARMRADGLPYEEAAQIAGRIARGEEAWCDTLIATVNLVPETYRGLDRYEARARIVAEITGDGNAVMTEDEAGNLIPLVEKKKIMQPFGDRSNVVIEPYLTDQWYVDAQTLAEPAIKAVEEGDTRFVPASWDKTYFQWMRNIEPWCISRQLWWGHQIPVWYGPDGEIFCAETLEEAACEAEMQGIRRADLTRDEDVLDTWFSSALWPFSTLGWPEMTPALEKFYPTSVLSTAFDIIFFWVARMMMFGLHFKGEVPFRTVYIHALVRDAQGQKMSKSKGNVIDPLDYMDKYGTDALRFTLAAMAAQGRDLKLSEARVEGYRNFSTKLWNAARFIQLHECRYREGYNPENITVPINQWITHELSVCRADIEKSLEAYRFNDMADAAYQLIWRVYCDWFLEFAKPVFQGEEGPAKEEVKATAAWVFDEILKLLHPVMPFVTERLWQGLYAGRDGYLMQASWPTLSVSYPEASGNIRWLIELISTIRSIRSEMNVPPKAMIPLICLDPDPAVKSRHTQFEAPLCRLARLETISYAPGLPKGAIQIIVGGTTYGLPLADIIDIDAEIARLEAVLQKSDAAMAAIDKKLENRDFMEKAPAHIVAEHQAQKAQMLEKHNQLNAARARLEAL